jgi:hypothetical protein
VPSPVWSDVADFATGAEARSSWSAGVQTLRGEPLQLLVAPLPTGSTLVTFRDRRGVARDPGTDAAPIEARAVAPTGALGDPSPRGAPPTSTPTGALPSEAPTEAFPAAEPFPVPAARPEPAPAPAGLAEAALLGDLALAELELPAEAALRSLAAAIGTAPDHAAFAALSSAAQALKDGLARARALQAAAEAALCRDETPAALCRDGTPSAQNAPSAATPATGRPTDPAGRLAALLALRGLTLGPVPDAKEAAPDTEAGADRDDADRIARALPPLAFALASLAAPGATVDLALGRDPTVVALRAPAGPAVPPASDAGDQPPVLALARRRLAALGATLEVGREAGRIALAARFPARRALAPPAAEHASPKPPEATPSTTRSPTPAPTPAPPTAATARAAAG